MPPPPPGMPHNSGPSLLRLPPEGMSLTCMLVRFLILVFSHRAKGTEMGANAEKAIRGEEKRRLCGHGKAGEDLC